MTETQTVDLASWLTAIWDEEERLAKEALAPDWTGSKTFYDTEGAQQDSWGVWLFHIHPDAVLARIAADRKILELHQPTPTTLEEVDGREVEPDSFEEIVSREVNCMACAGYPDAPCKTLRLLASPYKGREGWQEAWGHD